MNEESDQVPSGWIRVPLSEVAQPSKEKIEPSETKPGTLYLSLEHIASEFGEIIGRGTSADVHSTKAVFRPGDVLYGKLRPYLNKVAIPDFAGVCSTDIIVFPAGPAVLSPYLAFFLRTREVVEYANHHSNGVQLPRISFDKLSEMLFPLPPLAEQRRIVAKVEAVLARVNAARQRLAKAPALLKRFRQSVLAAACSGRLTAEWRVDAKVGEDGASLAKRIVTQNRYQLTDEGDRLDGLPDGWGETSLGSLMSPGNNGKPFVTSGSRGWGDLVGTTGSYFIRSECINTDQLRFDESIRINAPPGAESDRTRVRAGDLLLTITGNNVGKTATVPPNCPVAYVSQHVAIVRVVREMDVRFVWMWMRSIEHGQRQLQQFFYGYTKPGLNLAQVRSVRVAVPPLAEQHEIVRRVEALFALADKIEARITAARARADKLIQSTLAKAFRGELVPTEHSLAEVDGRGCESASELLIRVSSAPTAPARSRSSRQSSIKIAGMASQ